MGNNVSFGFRTEERFRTPKDISHNRFFNDMLGFDGNGNVIIKNNGSSQDSTIKVTMEKSISEALVAFYVDAGMGTNRRLGKTGDVGTILVSKDKQYTVSTSQHDIDVPGGEFLYFNKLIRPTKIEVFRHSDEFKLMMIYKETIDGVEVIPSLEITIEHNPSRGITLPRTVSDAIVEWLSYWFPCEAVERRVCNKSDNKRKRSLDCVFSGPGKNHLTDIYITNDKSTYEKLLVLTYDNSTRYLIFSVNTTNPKNIDVECLDEMTTIGTPELPIHYDNISIDTGIVSNMTGDQVLFRLNRLISHGLPKEYLFKLRRDVDAFNFMFDEWVRQTNYLRG